MKTVFGKIKIIPISQDFWDKQNVQHNNNYLVERDLNDLLFKLNNIINQIQKIISTYVSREFDYSFDIEYIFNQYKLFLPKINELKKVNNLENEIINASQLINSLFCLEIQNDFEEMLNMISIHHNKFNFNEINGF